MTQESRIRDHAQFAASVRSFQWLGKSTTGATDLDCLIERRGRFLVVEGKTWHDGLHVPTGQYLALNALAQLPQFTVMLVGETDGTEYFTLQLGWVAPLSTTMRGSYYPGALFVRKDPDDMRRMVKDWERAG